MTPKPCRFPGCTDPRYSPGTARYSYCQTHTNALARRRYELRAQGAMTYGYDQFEADIASGVITMAALTSRKPKRAVRKLQPLPPLPQILATLAEVAPYREPSDLTVYKAMPDDLGVEYRCKYAFYRRRVDVWLLLNGVYRPPRAFDDVSRSGETSRARAMRRLDELMTRSEEQSA